jgi:hypothetical protein
MHGGGIDRGGRSCAAMPETDEWVECALAAPLDSDIMFLLIA